MLLKTGGRRDLPSLSRRDAHERGGLTRSADVLSLPKSLPGTPPGPVADGYLYSASLAGEFRSPDRVVS